MLYIQLNNYVYNNLYADDNAPNINIPCGLIGLLKHILSNVDCNEINNLGIIKNILIQSTLLVALSLYNEYLMFVKI